MEEKSAKLSKELKSFQQIWEGGYYEGDPLNPLSKSTYKMLGFMSVLHATYLRCIKPYVNDQTVALEIGPGRGAWTKTLLPAKEVQALDAQPEEHNRFYEYLGSPQHVKYHQVHDFECNFLPDDHFNYMFSFGCLCHVSFEGIQKYAVNLYPKIKKGSPCFWMIADYEKHNRAIEGQSDLGIFEALIPKGRRHFLIHSLLKYYLRGKRLKLRNINEDNEVRPGRWYHAGIERTCAMLADAGYRIIDPDVGTLLRDPIIYFAKE